LDSGEEPVVVERTGAGCVSLFAVRRSAHVGDTRSLSLPCNRAT
jgi:hypothetical protein